MGIGSTNWALLGDGSRWKHDFSAVTGTLFLYTPGVSGFVDGLTLLLYNFKCYQRPFNMWGTLGEPGFGDRFNTGYFFWRRVSTPSAETDLVQMLHGNAGKGGSTNPRPQWKELGQYESATKPNIINHDLKDGNVDQWLNYQTGFLANLGNIHGYLWSTTYDSLVITQSAKELTLYQHGLWHYNPWAWFGTVPQVFVDIAMKCGVPRDMIDEPGFDNAHDAYDLTTGDSPWKSYTIGGAMATKYEIAAPRLVGETCSEMMLRVARHARDFFYTNEAGKLACTSFTRPVSYTLTGQMALTIGQVQWTDTDKHQWNSITGTWGSAALTSGPFTVDQFNIPADTQPYAVQDEDRCESYVGDKLSCSYKDTDSITRYGELPLKGSRTTRISMGRESEVEVSHYPYLLRPHTYYANALPAVQSWMSSDGAPSRVITLQQDLRALDWGIGTVLTNVAVTPDSITVPRMVCQRRTYDFDSLTVTSDLLQIPAL